MSRSLPADCIQLILSYLPLCHFIQIIPAGNQWKIRFQHRYNQTLKCDYKKLYLLRAATEQHEICDETLQLYDNKYYRKLIYYHAIKARDWTLIQKCLDSKVSGLTHEILAAAIDENRVDVVKRFLDNRIIPLAITDRPVKFSPEVLELFETCPRRGGYFGNNLYRQALANLSVTAYFRHMELTDISSYSDISFYCHMAKYNKDGMREKLSIFTNRGNPRIEAQVSLYFNELSQVSVDDQIHATECITWLATNAFGDWLLSVDEKFTTSDLCEMVDTYSFIPDASQRANETVQILLRYVGKNPLLSNYINAIKLITGNLTVNEFNFLDQIHSVGVIFLLESKQYKLLLSYDNYLKNTIHINDHRFTDVEELLTICKCKNVIVNNPNWMQIFSIPVLMQILTYGDSQNAKNWIQGLQQAVPDCLELV